MAIFHHSTQVIGRSSGRSSVAAAAYRLGVAMVDERTGQKHDFTRKAGVDSWHTLAPSNAPEWVNDPARLWNEVEAAEKRKDAQLCREVNIALPKELTPDQGKALALEYAREQWTQRGMVSQVAFHDLDGNNPHCHVMLTMREIGPDGFGKKVREWNDHALATTYREAWAQKANEALERYGHAARIDHRTLEAQGIDRAPTQHQGPKAAAMEQRGLTPDRQRVMPVPQAMDHAQAVAELKREREKLASAQEMEQAKAKAQQAAQDVKAVRYALDDAQAEAKAQRASALAEESAARVYRDAAARRDYRQREALAQVEGWRKAHPVLALFYEPSRVQGQRRKAEEAAKSRDEAKAQEKAKAAAVAEHWAKAKEMEQAAQTMAQALEKAEAIAKSKAAEVERLRERHAWESLTPEQQQQKREQERAARVERKAKAEAERAAAAEWARPMSIPDPNDPKYRRGGQQDDGPQQTQTRSRGRGWGMSM